MDNIEQKQENRIVKLCEGILVGIVNKYTFSYKKRGDILKFIKQHDEKDCGAACLAMIASEYKMQYPLQKYRELTKSDKMGTNIYGLIEGGKKLGLAPEALNGNINDLLEEIKNKEILEPFIAHVIIDEKIAHFVVVYKCKKNKIILYDPARGKCKYTIQDFAQIWTGYIVKFNVEKQRIPHQKKYNKYKNVHLLLQENYHVLSLIFIFSIIISGISIFSSYIFEIVINSLNGDSSSIIINDLSKLLSQDKGKFDTFFILLMILFFIQTIVFFFKGVLTEKLAQIIDRKIVLSYYNHLTNISIENLRTRQTGEYMSRISDAISIRQMFSSVLIEFILNMMMLISCGVILFVKNNRLFGYALALVIFYMVLIVIYKKAISESNISVMENNAKVQSFLKESIDGLESIKIMQAESTIRQRLSNKYEVFLEKDYKKKIINLSQNTLCMLVQLLGSVLILWQGFELVSNKKIGIGALMTFYALLSYFIDAAKNLMELQPLIQETIIGGERLNDIFYMETETQCDKEQFLLNSPIKTITIENVSFRYGNRQKVLDEINLTLRSGEKIGIVGKSGSGKTTLAKLLLGFYKPESGVVKINGKEIEEISLNMLRKEIAYISSDPFLFSDTVLNNLKVSALNVSEKEIFKICKLCKVDEFVQKMPYGYNTYLNENGKNLSTGQRQRIAIVQALLKKPSVIILDEAIGNFEIKMGKRIKEIIYEINPKAISIIITHQLRMVMDCEKIIVMESGKIVEQGTHEELLEKRRYYKELLKE